MISEDKKTSISDIFYQKIQIYVEKIYEFLEKIDIGCKIISEDISELENELVKNLNYPFKHYWIDYVKTSRKFFKKVEVSGLNSNSVIESSYNSSNKPEDFKSISNEIAIMLEDSNFIESMLLLAVSLLFYYFI